MLKRTASVFAAFLLADLFGLFAFPHSAQGQAAPISEISIERTPCYGRCPVYKLTLRRNGTATYVGKTYVDKIGTYTAKVGGFDRLAQAVEKRHFWHYKSQYTSLVTDLPSVLTTVVQGSRRKTVSNYANASPQSLRDIQALIDSTAVSAHWKKISSSTIYP